MKKANMEHMFDQCIESGEGELAGIQIEIWDEEAAGVCRGALT